jgi:hypothetical protein
MLPVIVIVAIGWIFTVLLMSLTEHSAVAGIMTFLLYGVLPLSIILYIFDAPRRRKKRELAEAQRRANPSPPGSQDSASLNGLSFDGDASSNLGSDIGSSDLGGSGSGTD